MVTFNMATLVRLDTVRLGITGLSSIGLGLVFTWVWFRKAKVSNNLGGFAGTRVMLMYTITSKITSTNHRLFLRWNILY